MAQRRNKRVASLIKALPDAQGLIGRYQGEIELIDWLSSKDFEREVTEGDIE